MHMILMTAVLLGTVPTESDLLNQKTEEAYFSLSQNDLYYTRLTLIRKKGIGGTRREVILQTVEWLKPFGKKSFMMMWKGTYTIKRTRKALLLECHFLKKYETGLLVDNSQVKFLKTHSFKPKRVTFHIEKFTPRKKKPSIQLYFTADKINRLHFWKEKESVDLY